MGESKRVAVAREAAEETGLAGAAIGPAGWTRSVQIPWAEPPFTRRETYRWWTLAEIEAPKERFAPRRIAALLRELFANGAPPAPIDAGV